MSLQIRPESFDVAKHNTLDLKRRGRDVANAAASARSLASTLLNFEPATGSAKRCCDADDRAWIAQNLVW